MSRSVVILGAARTPIGKYGGSFKDVHPAELGAVAARAALRQAGVAAADVEDVWMGHGRQAGSGPNPGRQVAHRAGIPDAAPARAPDGAPTPYLRDADPVVRPETRALSDCYTSRVA